MAEADSDFESAENDGVSVASESAASFPPLKVIWDCLMVERAVMAGKKAWSCNWCNKTFTPEHATRALKHVLKVTGCGVAVCGAIVKEPYLSRYQSLHEKQSNMTAASKRAADDIEESICSRQQSGIELLSSRREKGISEGISGILRLPECFGNSFSSSLSSKKSANSSVSQFFVGQPSISSSLENTSDIRKSNNASVEMAIADFFHCENIADQVVESPRFARLIKLARTVGNDFKVPSRKKISGELLNLNYDMVYNENKELLCREASTFGLSFIGDGAIIKRMPLLNILGLCAATPPITIGIIDCTNHMQSGGKKDASYIASLFEEKVAEYDPGNVLTDVFFFDGASNVQKAGEVLTAKYPRSFCFHGGEHVVSLFFSSISRIAEVKVSAGPCCCF
jgi:hypothetical protein